jgi:hypothetical protein
MSLFRAASRVRARGASGPQFQAVAGISTSAVRHGGFSPFTHLPPPPPPEFEPDGSPRRYPLQQPVYDHGYNWETWKLMPVGMFHTIYIGEFARDLPPHWAWLGSIPPWAGIPVVVMFGILTANMIQNLGSIGIRPKRFTPEWQSALKERERAENTNPVTRYLDRRREERGWQFMPSDYYPTHPYFMWMKDSHDWDHPVEGLTPERPE